jgi:methyltransferase
VIRTIFVAIVLMTVFGFLLVEARRASHNERAQRARGGVEPQGDPYAIMRVAYPGAFLAMIIEGILRGSLAPGTVIAGSVLFILAKALKWWAMLSLGPSWTFRVIVVPGAELVTSGPYRYLRHPNYVAVVGELAGVALVSGARVAGPIATAAFVMLMLKRIAVENRALGAILRRN